MVVKPSIIFGRFLFFAMILLQCIFLASFLSEYGDDPGWYAVIILFVPAVLLWWWISYETELRLIFIFWTVYIWLGLVPVIGIVFGRIGDKSTSKGFWNPSTLKVTLSITPLLLILTFHTKIATSEFTDSRRVTKCSLKAIINLCDGIELICVILDDNVCSHGISKPYKNTLIAFACLSYLWLPCVMAIDHYASSETRDNILWLFYYASQGVLETIFLGLRIGLSLRYGVTTSIFISKNIVMVIVYSRQAFYVFCGPEADTPSAEEQRNGESEAHPPSSSSSASSLPVQNTSSTTQTTVRVFRPRAVAPSAPLPPPYNPEMTHS